MDHSNKFRNINGLGLTKSLFLEMSPAKETVLYTLKDKEYQGFPSLYLFYMAEADPTEYRFAIKYMDGWGHWEDLCLCPWFKPYIDRWRRELEVKTRSEALDRILITSKAGNPKTLMQANKYLLDGGWVPKDMRKAGRPSKEQIMKETRRLADIERQVDEDLIRVKENGS